MRGAVKQLSCNRRFRTGQDAVEEFDDLEDFAGGQIRSVVDFDIGLLLQALKPNRMDRPGDQNLMHENDGGRRVKLSLSHIFWKSVSAELPEARLTPCGDLPERTRSR